MAQNELAHFNLSLLLNTTNLVELDLSYTKISFAKSSIQSLLANIQRISLAHATLFYPDTSFGVFLNPRMVKLDLSNTDLKNEFKLFSGLTRLEVFQFRGANLRSLDQTNIQACTGLTKLDLAYNQLTRVDYASLQNLTRLEYLDLSHNLIEFLDTAYFGSVSSAQMKPLKYLNVANNLIATVGSVFMNLLNVDVFRASNNRLRDYPFFKIEVNSSFGAYNSEFHLDHNNLSAIELISFWNYNLKVANFDSNRISAINPDALINLKTLETLSIANNELSFISGNNFYFQYNLKYLNLSRNKIAGIEANAFQNLNALVSLDLSYNSLVSLEKGAFFGLANLHDLFLVSQSDFELKSQSFEHLSNLSRLYLNASILRVASHKCLFMSSIKRIVQRNISNKYIFFKSLSLITRYATSTDVDSCELMFRFLQFKVHLNLFTDKDNDVFYDTCRDSLVSSMNRFAVNFEKCSNETLLDVGASTREHNYYFMLSKSDDNVKQRVFTDGFFLFTTAFILLVCVFPFCSFFIR